MFLKRFFKFVPKNDYSRALDLFNEGHHKKALKILTNLLERKDTEENLDIPTIELFACEAHVAISKQKLNNGDLKLAIKEMENAVALKPNFADLRYTLANLYVDDSRLDEGSTHFEKALEVNPKYFKARVSLARTLSLKGQLDAAIEHLDLAKESCPKFYEDNLRSLIQMVRLNRGHDEIQDAFYEIIEERPSSAQVSREIAVEAIQNGNYADAIRELKKAIAIKPDYPDLHNYLGIAYGNHGMEDDAIEEFETSLKINPYYLKARLNLALALYDGGRYEEAHNHIERVLTVQPQNELAKNLVTELSAITGKR